MAEADAEWELCKENIQPLRGGRAISTLTEALSLQQEGSSAITQRQQAFESELRVYEGDDPLDVWDRYIKWTEQTFPQGGKESNFSVLLERAVMKFTEEKKYYNDVRYVDLWIKFADSCPEPVDIYRYMQAQGIGLMLSAFYIAWSEEYEKRGNFRNADTTLQDGLKCLAEPRDRLKQFHKALQARVTRHVMSGMGQESDEDTMEMEDPNRKTLAELKALGKKKAVAPISRGSSIVNSQPRGLQMKPPMAPVAPVRNSRLMVFDENKGLAESQEPKLESWMGPPSARHKENEQKASKWTKAKLSQKTRAGLPVVMPVPAKPSFTPFVEECEQTPAVTPCKINPTVNSVLSARKPHRGETPLKRLQDWKEQQQQQQAGGSQAPGTDAKPREQSMYCKELLFSGASEFCFEELRAERYRQKHAKRRRDSGQSAEAGAPAASESCCEGPSSSGPSQ
ncbi:mitotic checkpoint serine/threonine-protein kinase BUB1 beta [Sardina pilchardus]|uniref:mitotic checkpoint serine/threonine-protein kinase BUB1 beta n=1 Tax=Sardina pilchardus TaxID=27697 RepID=UPI002E0EE76F